MSERETDQPPPLLRHFAQRLLSGEVIAFPTETFYGLLACIDQNEALLRLQELKGRSTLQPMPVIAADDNAARALWAETNEAAEKLIKALWPGPLTIVLPAVESVSPIICGNTGTVGVRVPGSAAARGIAAMCGRPLAATSANRGTERPARSAAEVRTYFGEEIAVAEGPELPASKGSTVLDAGVWPPRLLREGDMARDLIESVLEVSIQVRN